MSRLTTRPISPSTLSRELHKSRPMAALFQAKLALTLLLVACMGTAVAAGPGNLGNLTGQTFGISNTYMTPGSTFNDIYTFGLGSASFIDGITATINLDLPSMPGTEFELSNMSIRFVDPSGTTLGQDNQTTPANTTLSLLLTSTLPAATNYQFIVSGKVSGTFGGSYGGVLQAIPVTLPVPEADSYALMALGTGLAVLLARRRKA